jgi:hypothetical protein
MPMDRNSIFPRAWPTRPSSGWTTGKVCGMFPSSCTTHRVPFMRPFRCRKSGATNTRDSLMTAGTPTGRSSWNARRNWAWCPKTPRWWTGRKSFPRGIPSAKRENEVFVTADGGQCRFSGTCRSSYRTGHRPHRGNGRAGQYPGYLPDRRQRLHRGRNPHRNILRAVDAERVPALTMEQQLEKLEAFGGMDAWGGPSHGQPLFRGMGLRLIDPVPVDQADGVPFRRHHVRHGRPVSQSHQGQGRMAKTISERYRFRSHDSGSDRRSGTRLP